MRPLMCRPHGAHEAAEVGKRLNGFLIDRAADLILPVVRVITGVSV
jgi:hypothetical protein